MTVSNVSAIIPLHPATTQRDSVSLRNLPSLEEAAAEVASLAKEADVRILQAATKLVALKRRIEAGEAGLGVKWMEWLVQNIKLSQSYLYMLLSIGKAKDPKKRLEAYRKDSREKSKKYDAKQSITALSADKRLLLKAIRQFNDDDVTLIIATYRSKYRQLFEAPRSTL